MKVLFFLFLLHLIEIASQCRKRGAIIKEDLENALFVAKFQVERFGKTVPQTSRFDIYYLDYSAFYFSHHDLEYTKRYAPRIISINKLYKCPPLVKGKFYVIGCRLYKGHTCHFVREFDNITKTEEKLIRSMGISANYNYLAWHAY
ncbi:hypothetical protein ANCCAN_16287 [Ancylostoma caninum]|uniref:Uncharacterized protein n=1 Tax=Ancylostoma caninum TaxID=29170 RepID=A0A368G481_ANCCA|nr:hypothetical protein ANCCAN_16287 [Ancylostoma caninum]